MATVQYNGDSFRITGPGSDEVRDHPGFEGWIKKLKEDFPAIDVIEMLVCWTTCQGNKLAGAKIRIFRANGAPIERIFP